jgi:hypothetical protein
MAVRVMGLPTQIFTEIINAEQHYLEIFCNEFLPRSFKKYGKGRQKFIYNLN